MRHPVISLFLALTLLSTQGCALMDKLSTKIADKLASRMNSEVQKKLSQSLDGLTNGILNHDDPATILAGIPSYLIMLDSMLYAKPDDPALLMAAARLYGAYAGALVNEPQRAKTLTARARKYGQKALCLKLPEFCKKEKEPLDQFKPAVNHIGQDHLEALYVYGVSWAGWLQARTDDYEALADLPKIEYIFDHLTRQNESYDKGRAQLFLAVMRSQIPADLGGKPETARQHFERALKFSEGKDLMVKVKFARHYARLVYNQELHDRLLKEVIEADPHAPKLTLSNVMAQDEAKKLKADEYF